VFALALNSSGLTRAADNMAAAPAAVPGVKGEILMQIQQAEDKLVQLADAIPESKYNWSPGKGVRTVGEVFMHVAAANYGIPAMIGVKAPDGFNFETYEKSLTKKADIQKALKASFEHVKTTFTAMSDADMEKPQAFFGMKTTGRGTYLLVMSHCHEHLGQQIAYARSNGIVPPWTAKENAEEAKAKQK
jgi:uncharacterized damage-inducible protein DinB